MALPYRSAAIGSEAAAPADIRALQQDLRSLGYLARGIDGAFGRNTRGAIRALQYDLLHNDGAPSRSDGGAPVVVSRYCRGVTQITGVVDAATADSIEAMLSDPTFPKIPRSSAPADANKAALARVAATKSTVAPISFLLAIFQQESSSQHYVVPPHGDTDDFVVLGLDHNDGANGDHVTSRGYGLGQYTLFHHPPTAAELQDFVLDPCTNVQKSEQLLAEKFNRFVAGPAGRAEERDVEHPLLHLRLCKYPMSDPRYLSDCRACAQQAAKVTIGPDTPLYAGAGQTYGDAQAYATPSYSHVPDRATFACDWPYAVRRYNGAGPNSYHYQARVLRNLLSLCAPTAGGC